MDPETMRKKMPNPDDITRMEEEARRKRGNAGAEHMDKLIGREGGEGEETSPEMKILERVAGVLERVEKLLSGDEKADAKAPNRPSNALTEARGMAFTPAPPYPSGGRVDSRHIVGREPPPDIRTAYKRPGNPTDHDAA